MEGDTVCESERTWLEVDVCVGVGDAVRDCACDEDILTVAAADAVGDAVPLLVIDSEGDRVEDIELDVERLGAHDSFLPIATWPKYSSSTYRVAPPSIESSGT
jgi:hypothetical protein